MGHVDHGKTTLLDAIRKTSVVDDRGRRDHAAHRRLPGRPQRPAHHLPRHAGPRGVHRHARPRREGDRHRRARRRRRRRRHAADEGVDLPRARRRRADRRRRQQDRPARLESRPRAQRARDRRAAAGGVGRRRADRARLGEAGRGPRRSARADPARRGRRARPAREPVAPRRRARSSSHASTSAAARSRRCSIHRGTLKVGDAIVAGDAWGRVRALYDYRGERIQEARPGEPVEILGFDRPPPAGELGRVVENERRARELAHQRGERLRREAMAKQSDAAASRSRSSSRRCRPAPSRT